MITAIVSIIARSDRIPEAAQEITAVPGVEQVYSVTGDVDLIAVVRVREHEDLAGVIADRISKIEGIENTSTNIAFRTYSSADLDVAFDLGGDS